MNKDTILFQITIQMAKRCLFLIIILNAFILKGQLYSLGQNPAGVKWSQIKTENFQLIFPVDFESKAQELANILVYANTVTRKTLKTKPKKISIILQNNTTVDNGFVTLAPKRSEFYATMSQENEGVDWLTKLAVHEYRHVIQFEKYNQGIGKLFNVLFGEQGIGAIIVATTPLWFIEGDAVYSESENLTRGRANYGKFLREFKAQISELDSISYEKASFGSFKNYITDHYKLGYFLRASLSDSVWDELLTRLVRNPFPLYPFSYHLKKITGKSINQLYGDLICSSQKKIRSLKGFEEITNVEIITKKSNDYVSYENPVLVDTITLIAVKKSFDKPLRFVTLKSGLEQLLHVPGNYDENSLRYSNGYLIWSEKRVNPRWSYLDYSEVVLLNIQTMKRRRIKRKTRWFAPCLNPTADKIALVEVDKANNSFLLIVDLEGVELQRIGFGNREMIYHPNWFGANEIVLSSLKGKSNFLLEVDLINDAIKYSRPFSTPFSNPTPYKGGYLVETIHANKDFVAWWNENKLKKVVNPEFGLDFIALDSLNSEVIYADYRNNGSRLVRSEITMGYDFTQDEIWTGDNTQFIIQTDTFKVTKYKPLLNLFNFHSWAPFSINPSEQNANLGASVFSQNLLSSSILSLNYDYFSDSKSKQWTADYMFEHFYPQFFGRVSNLFEPNVSIQDVKTNLKTLSYQAGSKVNLYYNGSKFRKSFFLESAYLYSESDYDFEPGYKDTAVIQESSQFILSFIVAHKPAVRDLYSPLSLRFSSAYYFNLNSSQNAQVLNVSSIIRGFFKNDGLKFSVGKQWGSDFYVPNYLIEPRGVSNQGFKNGEKFSVEYITPLLYPDWKVGRLVYLQRIYVNMFYDFMQINDGQINRTLSSQGGTAYFDFNPLRYSFLSTFGIQLSTDREGALFIAPSFSVSY